MFSGPIQPPPKNGASSKPNWSTWTPVCPVFKKPSVAWQKRWPRPLGDRMHWCHKNNILLCSYEVNIARYFLRCCILCFVSDTKPCQKDAIGQIRTCVACCIFARVHDKQNCYHLPEPRMERLWSTAKYHFHICDSSTSILV